MSSKSDPVKSKSKSKSAQNALINDIVKTATWMIVVHVLTMSRDKKPMFDEKSVYDIIFVLVGLAVYNLVVVNIVKPLPQ